MALLTVTDDLRAAPTDAGVLEMIVRRPAVDARETLDAGVLDLDTGLLGDTWSVRGSSTTADGSAHPGKQITVMSARAVALVAGSRDRWPLAGDQLFVDMDLSIDNLPAGTQLSVGEAVIEVSEFPHLGCSKFSARFGAEALALVNSPDGKRLRLRGLNARVVRAGAVAVGDTVRKLRA